MQVLRSSDEPPPSRAKEAQEAAAAPRQPDNRTGFLATW